MLLEFKKKKMFNRAYRFAQITVQTVLLTEQEIISATPMILLRLAPAP